MFEFGEGSGKHLVTLRIFATDDGYILHLLGGDKPHVGAVVICQPRESLTGDGSMSCTTSSLPLPGHKDDLAAKPVAEALSKATGQPVVAVSGVHIDDATPADIERLQGNISVLTERLLRKVETLSWQ